MRRSLHWLPLCECLWLPFLEREIFTHFIRLFICVCRLSVWESHYVCECLFRKDGYSHTFFACLFVLDSLACMLAVTAVLWLLWQYLTSRLGLSQSTPTWRLISDRHDPPTFSGVGVHYLKFTSAISFRDMTSSVTVETVGNNLWRVATTRQTVTIRCEASPLLQPVTDRVYWTWVHGMVW